jgi:competence protein ComEC
VQVRSASPLLDTAIQPFADGRELQITAYVTRDGRLRQAAFGELQQTADVETEEIKTDEGQSTSVHSGIRLNIYAPQPKDAGGKEATQAAANVDIANSMRVFHYGERIRFFAKLRPPRNFRNPGAFDYEGYLAANGIAALGSAKLENVEPIPGFAGSHIEYYRTRIHRSVVAKVHQLWAPREAALIDAMVIGDEAFIDRDTRIDFQRSGTYHILVVSGMNVSILAFVVFWTLRRVRVSDVPATLLTVGSCVTYAFLTEVGAPVWRATLMCAIYLGTRLLYRDRAMVNALGAAALGLLVFDPRQLFTASFQMTFICVLIVAAIGLPMLERTSAFYRQALANWDSEDYSQSLPPPRGAVPRGFAVHRRPRRAIRRPALVATSGPLRREIWLWRIRSALHLRCDATGSGFTNGVLFPSRHHRRPPRKHPRCPSHGIDDASGSRSLGARLCVPVVSQGSGSSNRDRRGSHHRNSARPGRTAPG